MPKAVSKLFAGSYSEENVAQIGKELHAELGKTAHCAFVFITPDYLPFLTDFMELLQVHGHITDIAGCTAAGITGPGTELESGSGFSIVAFSFENAKAHFIELTQSQVEECTGAAYWQMETGITDIKAWITMLNPAVMDVEKWMTQWNEAFPGISCAGGLASGQKVGEDIAVFYNGKIVNGIAVGFTGEVRILAAISQGCRPIGEPLPVTRAEANVIFSLGSRPAYEALETAFNSLAESEKAEAKGNLLAGLASTEYVEEFKSSDFVVRNILGADPKSGAVAIGGFPRLGQTVQYQFRSKEAADVELREVLQKLDLPGKPLASLLFSCNGRGSVFFGTPNHDAGTLTEVFGNHASAGFFSGGEIGPAGGTTGIHGFTASAALFL